LTYAAAFARWYGARLTILHVVPTFEAMTVGPGALNGPPQIVMPLSRQEVLDEMRRITESTGIDSSHATLSAEAGDPVRNIVDQALAIGADLVVMGTRAQRVRATADRLSGGEGPAEGALPRVAGASSHGR
jgi:nucleotide-binding universal stress UspA family protein